MITAQEAARLTPEYALSQSLLWLEVATDRLRAEGQTTLVGKAVYLRERFNLLAEGTVKRRLSA